MQEAANPPFLELEKSSSRTENGDLLSSPISITSRNGKANCIRGVNVQHETDREVEIFFVAVPC